VQAQVYVVRHCRNGRHPYPRRLGQRARRAESQRTLLGASGAGDQGRESEPHVGAGADDQGREAEPRVDGVHQPGYTGTMNGDVVNSVDDLAIADELASLLR
jgi:hypothetical protein